MSDVAWAHGVADERVCALCGSDLRVTTTIKRQRSRDVVIPDLRCGDPACRYARPGGGGMGIETWTAPRS